MHIIDVFVQSVFGGTHSHVYSEVCLDVCVCVCLHVIGHCIAHARFNRFFVEGNVRVHSTTHATRLLRGRADRLRWLARMHAGTLARRPTGIAARD